MSTLPVTEEAGDAELISAVRGGDLSAYGVLFERHVDAARRLARQLANRADADDLVSDAFAKVMKVLQNGGGPDVAYRAYLLTAVRRLHIDRIRATSKLHTTDDLEPFDPGVPFRDTAVEGFENAAAAKAFASLPERWQLVLWHTEVEGQKPADVAVLLGMSANSVSALAYRAREGLRQAFLNSHAAELDDDQCRWAHEHLGGYVRHGLSKRDSGKVETHLDECRGCMAIYLELTEVNSNLGALLAPLLLGTAAGAAYLSGAAGSLAAKGGLVLLLGRAKDTVLANTGVVAVGGVAAVTAIAAVSIAVTTRGNGERPVADLQAPTSSAS
ncbi:MAG: sigma-70 family RNA polymerase sigma factor, partial [Nocardioides sp.]|nr:sigma-70 family RNA polymerase sigma factor [Nocardioides sp.]